MDDYPKLPSSYYDDMPLNSAQEERGRFKFWYDNACYWRDHYLELKQKYEKLAFELAMFQRGL
jgi:hypothetical protein